MTAGILAASAVIDRRYRKQHTSMTLRATPFRLSFDSSTFLFIASVIFLRQRAYPSSPFTTVHGVKILNQQVMQAIQERVLPPGVFYLKVLFLLK